MTRHRLPALALIVTALVAVVALVAHGRPLAATAGKGSGLPLAFWDYVVTSAIILVALVALAALVVVLSYRHEFTPPKTSRSGRLLYSLLALFVIGSVIAWEERHHLGIRVPNPQPVGVGKTKGLRGGNRAGTSSAHFVWSEALIFFVLLAISAAIFAARENRRRLPLFSLAAPEAVAAAVDESLDDLRSDPDLRRAIIAAYARMEKALGVTGLPRRPAEAPLEYLERALLELDTSGPSVRRLTDLFEWARFSQHEPEPSMRDEAVNALEAVRDELRAPVEVAA